MWRHAADAPDVALRLTRTLRPRTLVRVVPDFYRERVGRLGALGCIVVLAYAGGAAMFWFHSIYLGEGGPGISAWVHWLVDSTAGFVGLTVPILVIIPVAAAAARGPTRVSGGWFAAISGTLLAVATAPGPLIHDRLVGRGTWLAARATEWFGNGRAPTGHPQHLSIPLRMLQQIAFGIPLYVTLASIALYGMRFTFHLAESLGANSRG